MSYRLAALNVYNPFKIALGPMNILTSEIRCLYEVKRMNILEKDTEYRRMARQKSLEKSQ